MLARARLMAKLSFIYYRILHIADISAPRMGSSTREDEVGLLPSDLQFVADKVPVQPWAYECRENLRALLVGKEVTFVATHQLPPSTNDPGVQRDFGNVEFNGVDLATDLLRTGWTKVKEGKKGELGEEDLRKKDLEAEAKSVGRGIWKAEGPTVSTFPRFIRLLSFLTMHDYSPTQ